MGDNNNFTTEEVFNSAVSIVRNLPKEGSVKPSDELKLKLYAYYKQATHGINDTPKPRFYQIVEVYKWDAWKKLGEMSKEEAMLSYIRELKQIMESIPETESNPEDEKHFEDVLGKKFYDYWFKKWKQSGLKRQQVVMKSARSMSVSSNHQALILDQVANSDHHDSHSSSSRCSSMSLLEETQSTMADGYKTPTSLGGPRGGQVVIVDGGSDQVAAAILRLQKGLEETNSRMAEIERKLTTTRSKLTTTTNWPHWFYLSYPFLIYFILRFYERRRRARGDSSR